MQDILFTPNGQGTQNVRREKHVSAVYAHTVKIKDPQAPLGCGSIIFGSGSILRFVSIPQRPRAVSVDLCLTAIELITALCEYPY